MLTTEKYKRKIIYVLDILVYVYLNYIKLKGHFDYYTLKVRSLIFLIHSRIHMS